MKSAPPRRSAVADEAGMWSLASHDLRQPVQTLALMARTVAEANDDTSRLAAAADVALIAAGLDEAMGLLDFAASVGSRSARSPAVSDLGDLLSPLIVEATAVAAARGRRLEVHAPAYIVDVAPRLAAAIARAMLLHAARSASGRAVIRVTTRRRRERVLLEVSYAGPSPKTPSRAAPFSKRRLCRAIRRAPSSPPGWRWPFAWLGRRA